MCKALSSEAHRYPQRPKTIQIKEKHAMKSEKTMKYLHLVLLPLLGLGLAACGNNSEEAAKPAEEAAMEAPADATSAEAAPEAAATEAADEAAAAVEGAAETMQDAMESTEAAVEDAAAAMESAAEGESTEAAPAE
jgi:hypothetical protein